LQEAKPVPGQGFQENYPRNRQPPSEFRNEMARRLHQSGSRARAARRMSSPALVIFYSIVSG